MSDLERAFADRDFDDMMYPIHTIPEGKNVYASTPLLHKLPYFAKFMDPMLDKSMVIKYVIYAYDRNSPIFVKFGLTDDVKRKTTAAMYAGWKPDPLHGTFNEFVNKMLCGFNQQVNLMIIDYVRQYNDPEWSVLMAGYDALFRKLEVLSKTDSVDIKKGQNDLKDEEMYGKLFVQAQTMAAQLSEMSTKILTDDNKPLKKDLYCVIDASQKSKLNITPERMAGIM